MRSPEWRADTRYLKVVGWHDNKAGFAARRVELVKLMVSKDGITLITGRDPGSKPEILPQDQVPGPPGVCVFGTLESPTPE